MKPKKRKLNVRLLRRIQKYILEEPRRFFMEGTYAKAENQEEWKRHEFWYSDISATMPPCGTAACVAGWANLLSDKDVTAHNVLRVAEDLIGITQRQGDMLFLEEHWPEKFKDSYDKAKTPKQRAKIACARIDWLIKYGE